MNAILERRTRRSGDQEKQKQNDTNCIEIAAFLSSEHADLLNGTNRAAAIFNSSGRLVDCNGAYGSLYELPHELMLTGTYFQAILEHQVEMGNFTGSDPSQYVLSHLKLSSQTTEQSIVEHLPNGRVVEVLYIPINGGGWISSLNDISALYSIKEQLENTSLYDRATGLPNENFLLQAIDSAHNHQTEENSFALFAIDFSESEDEFTARQKHQLYMEISQRLSKVVRHHDIASKLQGSRFAVLQSEVSKASDSEALTKRLENILVRPYRIDNQSVSAGYKLDVILPEHHRNVSKEVLLETTVVLAKPANNWSPESQKCRRDR